MKKVIVIFTDNGVLSRHQLPSFSTILNNYKDIKSVTCHERFLATATELMENHPAKPVVSSNVIFGRIDPPEISVRDFLDEIVQIINFMKEIIGFIEEPQKEIENKTFVIFTDCEIGKWLFDLLKMKMKTIVYPVNGGKPSDMAVFHSM